MSRTMNNDLETAFICGHCRRSILHAESGTRQRNHSPFCLWSCHVDIKTGDDAMSLLSLAVKPVANLPFPAEAIQLMKEGGYEY